MLIALAGVILVIGIVLLWQTGRRQKALGMPGGRIISADMRGWERQEEPLYDGELGLTGRPDYLVQRGGQIIPVEVKSSQVGAEPHDGHVFQLAAYCLLVERVMGQRPPYGILHYPNRTYAIDFTPGLRQELLDLLDEMHAHQRATGRKRDLERSHHQPARCRRCGYRSICDQRLDG